MDYIPNDSLALQDEFILRADFTLGDPSEEELVLKSDCLDAHGKDNPLKSKDRWITSRVLMGF